MEQLRARRWMLGFLTLGLLISHLDRHLLAIALEQIKSEFALSDTELGVLSGLPFAVVFVLFGFLSARVSRPGRFKILVVVSLVIWSAATFGIGLAGSFAMLVVLRIVVGGGEAVAVPPSHAMIAQAYPPDRRASALAVFQTGSSLGLFLAFVAGGVIIATHGWRVGFMVAGGVGLVLAVPMALGLHEVRHSAIAPGPAQKQTIRAVACQILGQRSSRYVLFGMILSSVVAYGGVAWMPAYLLRVHEMPLPQIGLYLAATIGLVGALGIWLGGVMSDRMETRSPGGRLRFVALTQVVAKLGAVTFYLLGPAPVALMVFLVPVFLNTIYTAPSMAHVYARVAPQDRPAAAAILMFCIHLFGLSLGPLFVGVVSDLAQGTMLSPLGLGMLLLQTLGFAAAWCFWRAARA